METYNNVKEINWKNYDCFEIERHNTDKLSTSTILVIDCFWDDAFAHWVFESAIFLPFFNQDFIYLRKSRTYKTLFCKFFKIDKIIYELPEANICMIPTMLPLYTSLNVKDCPPIYKYLVDNLFSKFKGEYPILYDYVIMPRQTKENYKGNDKKVDLVKIISRLPDAFVLHTDLITDLDEQIRLVNSGKTIIVTDGSPFQVNGMFSRNRNIIVIGMQTVYQALEFPKIKYILEKIKSQNNVRFCQTEEDFLKFL
jgi:hypothetical protein